MRIAYIFIAKPVITALAFAALAGCSQNAVNPRLASEMPNKIIWAWERPEDLTFLNPNEFGVAFLAQTVLLERDEVRPRARRQPLTVSPGTYMIAVTRIETNKTGTERPAFDAKMATRAANLVIATLELPDVRGIQIDFDAVVSERDFYRRLIIEIRQKLPPEKALTMTSLASWCVGDAWFNDFPVDEAVPMVFQMGADDEKIKFFLRSSKDWSEPLCRGSYGISLEEGHPDGLKSARRIYLFKNASWKRSDIEALSESQLVGTHNGNP